MATNIRCDEKKKEVVISGFERLSQMRAAQKLLEEVLHNLKDTVPAEDVQREIRKTVPFAGTPAGALRAYRFREGLSQGALAKRTGIAQPHISAMENGESIGLERARKLAEALNCRWERLLSV